MNEVNNKIGLSFYLGKDVALFVQDRGKGNIQRKDGILRGFDDVNYYLEMTQGPKTGYVVAYQKSIVIRIEPVIAPKRGGFNS